MSSTTLGQGNADSMNGIWILSKLGGQLISSLHLQRAMSVDFEPGGPGSVENPSNYPQYFAIGAVDSSNALADFSLQGPSPYGEINPDILHLASASALLIRDISMLQ